MKTKLITLLFAIMASISSSYAAITVRLDAQSAPEWNEVYLWAWAAEGNVFAQWPGLALTQDEDGWYSYTFAENIQTVNIIWSDGINQTVDITNISESTCFALKTTTGNQIGINLLDCSTKEPVASSYEHVQIGDLYYNLNGITLTAEVTYHLFNNAANYSELTTNVNIPEEVTYDGITYPVKRIGNYAFRLARMRAVVVPSSVTEIALSSFNFCANLSSVSFAEGLTVIGENAFRACSQLTSLTIPSSVTAIGQYAFTFCSMLTSINVAENNMNYSSIDGVLFNKTHTTIVQYPLGKTASSYSIPEGVTAIGDAAFDGCQTLTSMTFPNSVTSIGAWAFAYCSNLMTISIPQNTTEIGDAAFLGCEALTDIYNFALTPQSINSSVFDGDMSAFAVDKSNCRLHVPQESLGSYEAAEVWGDFSNKIGMDIPESIEDIHGTVTPDGCRKLFRDGQIYIQNRDKIYSILGQKVSQ